MTSLQTKEVIAISLLLTRWDSSKKLSYPSLQTKSHQKEKGQNSIVSDLSQIKVLWAFNSSPVTVNVYSLLYSDSTGPAAGALRWARECPVKSKDYQRDFVLKTTTQIQDTREPRLSMFQHPHHRAYSGATLPWAQATAPATAPGSGEN